MIDGSFKAFFEDYDDATTDVKRSTHSTFESNLERWFEVLSENLELVTIIDGLENSINFPEWYDSVSSTSGGLGPSGQIRWPSGNSNRIAMQLAFMRAILKGDPSYVDVSQAFFDGDQYHQMIDATCRHVFDPVARDLRKFLTRYTSASQSDADQGVPASDRVVAIDHNSPHYTEALQSLDAVEAALQAANDIDPVDKDQRIAEIRAGRNLLEAVRARAETVLSLIYRTLKYISKKFTDTVLGATATGALALIGRLTGLW